MRKSQKSWELEIRSRTQISSWCFLWAHKQIPIRTRAVQGATEGYNGTLNHKYSHKLACQNQNHNSVFPPTTGLWKEQFPERKWYMKNTKACGSDKPPNCLQFLFLSFFLSYQILFQITSNPTLLQNSVLFFVPFQKRWWNKELVSSLQQKTAVQRVQLHSW